MSFAPIYVFWGEEKYLLSKEVAKLKKEIFKNSPMGEAFNFEKIAGDVGAKDIIGRLQGMPFGADMRLVLVEDTTEFSLNTKITDETERNDKLLMEYVENYNPQSVLVLTFSDKLNKQKSLYKFLQQKGTVQEFNALKGKEFTQWAVKFADERGKKFSPQGLGYLNMWDGTSLEVMANELEKVCTYVGEKRSIELEDLELMLTANAEVNVFKLVDMLAMGKAKEALELLDECLRKGEAPLMIMALIVRQFRNLLLIKSLLAKHNTEKEIAQKLGLHPYGVSKGVKQCARYKEQDLRKALEKLLEGEILLKSTNSSPQSIMERLVMELC